MKTDIYLIRLKQSATKILSVLFFIALLSGAAKGMGTSQRSPLINIEAQEARLSPVIIGSASVFMDISNRGESADNLIGAKADLPDAIVEIHDTKNGKMVKIEKVQIPSGGAVKLKPGSLHIMIFHMPEDIKEGSEFKILLLFEKSGEKQINVTVKGVDTHKHMHH
ncbi:MAG: copper chaperone PCu(A)C [Nitrospiraceae bacterium]|nr:MAG: copper chaperone PCu(A)C [Nitrospiraceae bacterium]